MNYTTLTKIEPTLLTCNGYISRITYANVECTPCHPIETYVERSTRNPQPTELMYAYVNLSTYIGKE